ncbi:hypothetical protein CEXT_328481 [Caerostris extrusa]|uniref:Uncharacterized protein n=1 Tax=Caerostris extrusa TaxID=172846 RepID=A0AAV4NNN8_CAEEX|nr:hypothetical protein CEXT_328481 [Caerostris extrusa]
MTALGCNLFNPTVISHFAEMIHGIHKPVTIHNLGNTQAYNLGLFEGLNRNIVTVFHSSDGILSSYKYSYCVERSGNSTDTSKAVDRSLKSLMSFLKSKKNIRDVLDSVLQIKDSDGDRVKRFHNKLLNLLGQVPDPDELSKCITL